ncbi:hypothetical protein [Acinetobacter phage ABPH49]|nr:hypothetical protein [Acinetobacter phage ABPH49]
MSDGRVNKCKCCNKKDVSDNRSDKLEKYRAYDRDRGNRQSDTYIGKYRKEFPKKYKAHNAVNNALRDGRITKGPCEICGAEKSVGHHDDYDKPLEVRWLCQGHHKQWHAEHGEALNAR